MAVLAQWMILLHIVSAFIFVGGLIGREVTLAYARRQEHIEIFVQMIALSRWFDLKIVSPGSHAILLFGLGAAWLRGWPILGALQGSSINWVFVSLLLYLTTVPLVFLVLIPRGKLFRQRLAEAELQGRFTSELRTAMDDQVVRAAHLYEGAIVAFIIYLMVMKPF